MDENENIGTPAEETEDSFLDGWDSADDTETAETPDTGTEAEPEASPEPAADGQEPPQEPAGETDGDDTDPGTEPPSEPSEPPQPPQEPPRNWTLQLNGQPVTVNEADLTALAQRGIDAEGLRAELAESRPVMDLFKGFAAQAGMSPKEYLTALRAQAMQAKGMTQKDARRAVELEDREAAVRQREAAEQARQAQMQQAQEQARQLEAKRQAEVREFIAVFPDAARGPIPQEVWNAVNQGFSLTAAYARYANAQAEAARQAEEEAARQREAMLAQNQQNAAQSAGSMRSAGSNHVKDPFLEGWDEN